MTRGADEALYGEQLAPGALVGGYVVERVHHAGPQATLYRARDARTGAPAALKVLHTQLAASRTALRRFHREASALRQLRHPGVVEIWAHGELPDGRPYIAMEWLEGRDLGAELAARGALSPREALEVLEQVGAALGAAHRAGLVHRDVKPQNVVARPRGERLEVKLVDFGVARPLRPEEGLSTLTHTGAALGTPLSMAPEQVRGEVPDARTDVYGLGVLLYQLVTGRPPFEGATRHEVEEQHLHAPPPRAADRAPVPAALDAVVARCMQKAREARYPSVEAALEELRQAVRQAGAPRPVRAQGLYVEARWEGEPDEALMEGLDALLERAAEEARGAGLELALSGAGCLLAVAAPAGEAPARTRLLEAASRLTRLEAASGRAWLAVTVHEDGAHLRWEAGGHQRLTGGRLLRPAEWTGPHPGRGRVGTGTPAPSED